MTGQAADPMVDFLASVAEKIEKHGWAVQAVAGDTPLESFTYTVGLTAKGLPELWIGSLAPRQAGMILNGLAELAVKSGPLAVGVPVEAEFSVPFVLRGPVAVDEAEVFVASRLHPDRQVDVLQVMWPDPEGLFPTDDGYDKGDFPQRVLPLAARCDECGTAHEPDSHVPVADEPPRSWAPLEGQRVAYRSHPAAAPEFGVVTEVVDVSSVRVRYDGDSTAKLTRVRDLEVAEG